jgi:hypothetical protein
MFRHQPSLAYQKDRDSSRCDASTEQQGGRLLHGSRSPDYPLGQMARQIDRTPGCRASSNKTWLHFLERSTAELIIVRR